MESNIFLPADILIPQVESLEKWSVIACDQFTSQPEYWENIRDKVGSAYSSLHLLLPEAELERSDADRIQDINDCMYQYLQEGVWTEYQNSYVYVERTLQSGLVRKGLLGMIDLEAYDYEKGSTTPIRATEKTIIERIPPRKQIRQNAPLELPHILLLCDDDQKMLIEPLEKWKEKLPLLYDFELMEHGGHIAGWLLQGAYAEQVSGWMQKYIEKVFEKYKDLHREPVVFAVGDGNHSLATAKACYEEWKQNHPKEEWSSHPSRYALVELENLYDDAQKFEPIHRLITEVDVEQMLMELKNTSCKEGGFPIYWYSGEKSGIVYLDLKNAHLPVEVLERFLKEYLQIHKGKIDYIHGDRVLKRLAKQEETIGFLMPSVEKNALFSGIIRCGVFPRKTFSMGQAEDKRYYLEARQIQSL